MKYRPNNSKLKKNLEKTHLFLLIIFITAIGTSYYMNCMTFVNETGKNGLVFKLKRKKVEIWVRDIGWPEFC